MRRKLQTSWALSALVSLGVATNFACGSPEADVHPGPIFDAVLEQREAAPNGGPTRHPGPQVAVETPKLVLIVLIDTLRADVLGAYGNSGGHSPEIDRFARSGVLFEQAYATSSWTRPSVASLFTSRYPRSVRVRDRDDGLADDYLTLAEILRERGWQTAAFSTNRMAGPDYGFDQGFDTFESPELRQGYSGGRAKQVAEGVTSEALDWLRKWASDKRSDAFVYLHYIDPHEPYLRRPDLIGKEPKGRFDGSIASLFVMEEMGADELTDLDKARIAHLYAGEVRYVDRWIGRLFDGLDELGLTDSSLVVVTSDHGEGLWEHGWRGHTHDLYEESIRIPLIFGFPGRRLAPDSETRIQVPVSLVDVAPTLLAVLGIDRPSAFEGHDLGPLMRGGVRPTGTEEIYAELHYEDRQFDALRSGSSKVIRSKGWFRRLFGGKQLFDLAADPAELAPRRRDPRAGILTHRLERWTDRLDRRAGPGLTVAAEDLDPETLERLKALGYLR